LAIIENGGSAQQRVVTGPLERLPQAAQEYAIRSPALLIVGEIAALAERLHWFGAAPRSVSHVAHAMRAA